MRMRKADIYDEYCKLNYLKLELEKEYMRRIHDLKEEHEKIIDGLKREKRIEKVLMIIEPHDPTGTGFNAWDGDRAEFDELCKEHGLDEEDKKVMLGDWLEWLGEHFKEMEKDADEERHFFG